MNKMVKSLLIALTCVTSLCALAACGGGTGGGDTSSSSSAVQEYFLVKDTALTLIMGDEYILETDYYVETDGEVTFRSSTPGPPGR